MQDLLLEELGDARKFGQQNLLFTRPLLHCSEQLLDPQLEEVALIKQVLHCFRVVCHWSTVEAE